MTHPSIKLPSPSFSNPLPESSSPPLTTSCLSASSPEPSSAVSIHQRRGFNFRLTLHLPQRDRPYPHMTFMFCQRVICNLMCRTFRGEQVARGFRLNSDCRDKGYQRVRAYWSNVSYCTNGWYRPRTCIFIRNCPHETPKPKSSMHVLNEFKGVAPVFMKKLNRGLIQQ